MRRKRAPFGAATFLAAVLAGAAAQAGLADLKGTKPGELPANDVPGEDRGPLLDPETSCRSCHRNEPAPGASAEEQYPWNGWSGSMMANAARDPVFKAALAVANKDMPGVGVFCLRCHTPSAYVFGRATPPDGSGLIDIDRQGVGCDVCHRAMQALPPDAPYVLGNAQIFFSDKYDERGPYERDDVDSFSHKGLKDTGLSDSRFCAQCHQVSNPERKLKDATGADTALEFPLDTTYEEWAQSDFARSGSTKSCQDCHMVRREGTLKVAVTGKDRVNPRTHTFVGGNVWGLRALMTLPEDRTRPIPDAEQALRKASFELNIQRTLETLRRAVALTTVDVPSDVEVGRSFALTVKVENLSGHKFPTGYAESRQAWIAVSLKVGTTETALLGAYDVLTGRIQAAPPTRVYKAQHGRFVNGKAEHEEHLVLHDAIVSDTRIPPRGFVPTVATKPTAEIEFPDVGNGQIAHYDRATLTASVPASTAPGPGKLVFRVYYQSMTREYLDFLAKEGGAEGAKLKEIYEQTDKAPPIEIAMVEKDVTLTPAVVVADAGGDVADGGLQDGGGGCGCRTGLGRTGGPGALELLAAVGLFLIRRRGRF